MVGKLEPGTRGGMHTHTAEEVAFIHTGTAELVIGGERRRVGRGGMALIPALVPHDVYSVGEETLTMVNFFPSAATGGDGGNYLAKRKVVAISMRSPATAWTKEDRHPGCRRDLDTEVGGLHYLDPAEGRHDGSHL